METKMKTIIILILISTNLFAQQSVKFVTQQEKDSIDKQYEMATAKEKIFNDLENKQRTIERVNEQEKKIKDRIYTLEKKKIDIAREHRDELVSITNNFKTESRNIETQQKQLERESESKISSCSFFNSDCKNKIENDYNSKKSRLIEKNNDLVNKYEQKTEESKQRFENKNNPIDKEMNIFVTKQKYFTEGAK